MVLVVVKGLSLWLYFEGCAFREKTSVLSLERTAAKRD